MGILLFAAVEARNRRTIVTAADPFVVEAKLALGEIRIFLDLADEILHRRDVDAV
jgi:hypothetical protein